MGKHNLLIANVKYFQSKLDYLFRIIGNRHFLKALIIPPTILFILNVGIIFNLPNYLEITSELVKTLSESIENSISLPLFSVCITIFILFFAFVQFSLSRTELPYEIIIKYIIEDEHTLRYIGYQFSFSLILAYFTITSAQIRFMNHSISITIVLFSILLSLVYFFWLVNNISAKSIFKLILKRLNLDEINKIENEALSETKSLQKILSEKKLDINISTSSSLFLSENPVLTTEKRGLIRKIDIDSINTILEEYKNVINKVFIRVRIGEYIPKYDPLTAISIKTTFLEIEIKQQSDEIKHEELQNFKVLLSNPDFVKKLSECFVVEDPALVYINNIIFIDDLFYFFMNSMKKDPSEADKLLELFSNFILDNIEKFKDNQWIQEVGLSENLFLRFVDSMIEIIRSNDIDRSQFNVLLTFIYSVRNLAVFHRSFRLMNEILTLLERMFYKIISETKIYNSRISISILHLREISFYSIVYGDRKITYKEVCKLWTIFYYPLIRKTIDSAISTYYMIIKYFHNRSEEDNYNICIHNAQYLLEVLSPLNHFEPFEKIMDLFNDEYKKKEKEIIYSYARDLVQLAIVIFFRVKKWHMPKWLLLEIAFPICNNCNTIAKYKYPAKKILNEFFFDYDFNEPFSTRLSEEFEVYKVHETGGYSPRTVNFDEFWISYAFYHYRMSNNTFFPNRPLSNSDDVKIRLKSYMNYLENYDSEIIFHLFDIANEDFNKFIKEYKIYIENMFENN